MMPERFITEEDVLTLVRSFENATISRDEWKHAEHLVVALYYLNDNDLEVATQKMRAGLFNLLSNGFGVDLTVEMPYHETLTIFWMRTVAEFNELTDKSDLVEKANELAARYDKDYPLRYYSRELLFSDKARAEFIEADIK